MGDDRSVYDLGEGDHLEDMGIDGRIILKRGVGWIDVVQDRDRRRTVVNAVMKVWFSIKCGICLDQLRKFLAFQKGLCSI
jgi:hypothetical protein